MRSSWCSGAVHPAAAGGAGSPCAQLHIPLEAPNISEHTNESHEDVNAEDIFGFRLGFHLTLELLPFLPELEASMPCTMPERLAQKALPTVLPCRARADSCKVQQPCSKPSKRLQRPRLCHRALVTVGFSQNGWAVSSVSPGFCS